MAESIRCPHCGALNRAEAEWCGQCYERLVEPEPEPEPVAEPVAVPATAADATVPDAIDPTGTLPPPSPTGEGGPAFPGPGAIPAAAVGTERGAFKVTDSGIVWTCGVCDTTNPIETLVCEGCGAAFAETVRPKVERPQRDPGTAALISLFLPGAGHAYLGLWGQAVARAALSLWAIFVVAVSVMQRSEKGSLIIALIFAAIATGLWAVTAHDAYREARFEEKAVLLKGRGFLYLVLGMLMLLMILLTMAGLSARN